MASLTRSRLFVRLILVAAVLLALILSLGSVAAATPTVTANPALVPFDRTPGKPGTTTLTFTAAGTTGLTACGQDNAVTPFALGPVSPSTPLVVPFPFIQAGKYTFWVSADSTCAVGTKFIFGGVPVQATATRVGPTGKAGMDDVGFRFTGPNVTSFPGGGGDMEMTLLGIETLDLNAARVIQTFPIPGVRVCIMSGDGAQVNLAMQVGQDARTVGLGAAAVTTLVTPFAGQNGCFDVPWVVNGGYTASITRSGTTASLDFCLTLFPANVPSNPPTASGIGKCAQVALFPSPNNGSFPPGKTLVNGSIVTGADNHAVEVCVSAFSPNPNLGRFGAPFLELANQVNAYNASGAVNLTPLDIGFPPNTVVKITTYDITGPGPGGQGGAQFVCPPTTATQEGNTITAITAPDVPGATIIDTENYFRGTP